MSLQLEKMLKLVVFSFLLNKVSANEGVCHACLIGVKELVKSVPILKKATSSVRDGDKELALADAMPSFCSSSNFHGYSQDLVTDCKTFLAGSNADGALEKTLISGEIDENKVCEAVCSVVDESLREPKRVETKPSGGNKATKNAKTGTVNDPAYKEALKKKEARDKKRMASAAAADAEAAADATAQSEEAKKVKKEKRKVKQPKEERSEEKAEEVPSPGASAEL